jgi:hypothetical protein
MSNPTRRTFLQSTLGVAVTAACAPSILKAEDKAVAKALIVGSGAYTYEVLDGWAKLPDNIHFGNTHSVQETADGRIIIHHTGHQSTCFFDPDGKFIESWGDYPGHAHGMDLRTEDGQEFLYLAPTGMHKCFKTDLKGNVLLTLEYPKDAKDPKTGNPCYAEAKPYVPTFTAFAPNGDFYITDGYGAGDIHRYNIKGEYLSTFGGKGDADDRTACPHGIYCDTRNPSNPLIVVADREHHRLQYFTLDGKLDHLVKNDTPEQDKDDTGKFRRPCHFNIRGTEMVVPDLRGRVTVLDKDNNVLAQLGDNPNAGQRANNGVKKEALVPGAFCCPHGACFDRAGNIYVAEWLPYGRVTKLRHVNA